MSEVYLPYARKYRPSTLAQYIANGDIKEKVMNALRGNSKPQVLLFEGHAGCGKTTMARLVAKEYLCENRSEFSGACGECYSCKALEEYIETGNTGLVANVTEIDVTDANKKDDISEILDDMSLPSYDGNWKIYILDECHAMGNAAQNRLLKTLEEPPEKVLIILCTTDPEKLLNTILSRCQYRFHVVKPDRKALSGLLASVCQKEGVKWDSRALSLVCAKGDFVPRNTLNLLEQIVREKSEVSYDNAVSVLNIVADEFFFEFFSILLEENINIYKYVTFLGKIKQSMDIKNYVSSLLAFTVRGVYIQNGVNIDALDKSEIKQYKDLFGKFNVADVAYIINELLSMKTSTDIETKLMVFGYNEITRRMKKALVHDDVTANTHIDTSLGSSGSEAEVGNKAYQDSMYMTEEDKQSLIERNSKPMTPDAIAEMLGGTVIKK